jgi:type II secretory pathway component PulF
VVGGQDDGDGGDAVVVCLRRSHCIALLAAPVLWLCAVTATTWRVIPVFAEMYAGLGAELPVATRIVIAGRHLWWLCPLAALAALWDFSRRERPSARHLTVLFVGIALLGMCLMAFWLSAIYRPMFDLINKI